MIEEEPGAAANHRLAASRRLPSEPYARREIELVAEMRLKFVARAEREREVAVHAKIVLRKPGGVILTVTQRRIAAIDGELRRRAEPVLLQRREGVSPVEIAAVQIAARFILELEAASERVPLGSDGQVFLILCVVLARVVRATGRTAAVKSVQHVDRRRVWRGAGAYTTIALQAQA